MGLVVRLPQISKPIGHSNSKLLEPLFFLCALLFVLWTAQEIQLYSKAGMSRWIKDTQTSQNNLTNKDEFKLPTLWCNRDKNFILQTAHLASQANCQDGLRSKVSSWLQSTPSGELWSTQQKEQVLQVWQKDLALRSQQWRKRLLDSDALQISLALAAAQAETSAISEDSQKDFAQSSVSLEPQFPSDVLRMQTRSNERMMQWDTWAHETLLPAIHSPVSDVQADTLWTIAETFEGVGSDAGAKMVRQLLKSEDFASKAQYLQNITDQLPWFLAGHWLLTVLVTLWMRAQISPIQQLNGLMVLGLFFWTGLSIFGAAPSPTMYVPQLIGLGAWMIFSWVTVHFYPHKLSQASSASAVNASWIPCWWLFTAVGWLLLLDQSLNFHERLRFIALDQWWAWCVSAIFLPGAAWLSPWLLPLLVRLGNVLWGLKSRWWSLLRIFFAMLTVAGFYAAHELNIPQHVTGELLKAIFIVSICGWCVWKMPLAAQLWHNGHARAVVKDFVGVVLLISCIAAAAFLTSDKGPLLVMALLLTILLASVLGWTTGVGMLILGFAIIFLLGVDLSVVGERLQAWRDPFMADRDDLARLMWFQLEASRSDWGFGVGQVPWCGTSRLDVCQGLPLQLQSDYTFTAIMGWWGPWGAWLWLLFFSVYAYRALVYCAQVSPKLLTPLALLQSGVVQQAYQVHLLFLFAVLLLVQTWITVAGNLGWLPLTGITWPLMSYGKSSLWISTFFVGAWGMRRTHA